MLSHVLMVRELAAGVMWVWVLNKDSPVVAHKMEGKQYAEQVQKEGKEHQLWLPHWHVFLGLLDGVLIALSWLQTPPVELKAKVEQPQTRVQTGDDNIILTSRMSKVQRPTTRRRQRSCTSWASQKMSL